MLAKKVKQTLKRLAQQPQPAYKDFEKRSYAQSGEDLLIDYIFRLRNISQPSFLDLGANHPYCFNNTFLFYQRGAHGVNIDANPDLIDYFNEQRPLDRNINTGVGGETGQMEFYIINDPVLSTFSKTEALMHESQGRKITAKIPVQISTLNTIINEYCGGVFPDLVSIDVEGVDELIVKSMDFNYSKPKVICLETVEYTIDGTGKKKIDLIHMVVTAGYTVYADTNINTIFVENDFWFNPK